MVPGVNDLSRSGGKSQTFFPSGPELICCLQNASTGHLLRTYLLQWTFFSKKRHFALKLLFTLCPLILSSLAIVGNSPIEWIGSEKTMLNRSEINVISYDLSHSARVHPGCTLPCSKIVDHIYCPESERIRGAKINIWCPTLLSPVPGTTLSWQTPKNMFDQYISHMKQDIFWYSESLNVVWAETFGHRLPKFSKVFWKMISFQPSNGREEKCMHLMYSISYGMKILT